MRLFANQVAAQKLETDFYKVLGVESTATQEQIKAAYRTLAKRYHPDVKAAEAGAIHEPDVEKFRGVLEAYQVLSVKESRANFDLTRKKNPAAFEGVSDHQFAMNHRKDLRDHTGNVRRTPPTRGSYAEERLAELKKERAKYNVNDLGFYKGGVPRKFKGTQRGEALGPPGEFHSPQVHNYFHFNHQDSARVTSDDATLFKNWMGSDRADFLRTKPAYPMYFDRDFNYAKDRDFWLKFIVGMVLGIYAYRRYFVEVDRARRTARMEGFKDMPAHHFHNRGGVIVLKDFVGF